MTGIRLGKGARKRKNYREKFAIIQQTMKPGMNISLVARLHGIQPILLFRWKKQYLTTVTIVAAGEDVVPASELVAALKQVREIQRLLGKKTMEVEILKEAMEYDLSRKWIAHAPLLPKDGKRQKDAKSADKKAADMLAKYECRKGILDTQLSELEKWRDNPCRS